MIYLKKISLLAVVLLFISLPSMAQSQSETEPYVVDLIAKEFSFEHPPKIKSGWVTFRFKNQGNLTHVAQIMKLKSNLSAAELDSTFKSGGYPSTTKVMGGPGLHSGGMASEVTVYLKPGIYVMSCGTRMKNDVAHFELGMVSRLEVTEEIGAEHPPQADMSLTLEDYQIKMGGDLRAGKNTLKIDGNNTDYDVHLVALEGESTEKAAYNYFSDLQDPTPAKLHGGVEEGHISYYTVDIQPGNYLLSSQEFGVWGMQEKLSISDGGDLTIQEKVDPQKLQITMEGYDIAIPEDIETGRYQITVKNTGTSAHEPEIWKLQEGKTAKDWLHWMESNRKDHEEGHHNHTVKFPGEGYGGIRFDTITSTQEQVLTFNLEPGTYVAVCYAENEEGNYHIEEGEIVQFEVQ